MMKLHRKFITKVALLLMVVVSCFTMNSVYAATETVTVEVGIKDEIEDGLVAELYKIAAVDWDYSEANYYFTPVSGFESLFNNNDLFEKKNDKIYFKSYLNSDNRKVFIDEQMMQGKKFPNDCAKIILAENATYTPTVSIDMSLNTDKTKNVGSKPIETSALYFMIARGSKLEKADYIEKGDDGEYTTIAYSYDKKYNFSPYVVFFNSLEENNLKRVLKYEENDRFGVLNIVKTVSVYGGSKSDTDCYIRVTAYKDEKSYNAGEKPVYETILTVHINKQGKYDPIELKGVIPVGSYVIVTEEYPGASYKLITEKTVTVNGIVPLSSKESPQTVGFTNKFNDKSKTGYGYNNTFVKTETPVSETKKIETWDLQNDQGGAQ